MIRNIVRGLVYFTVFVLIQVLILNNIYYLRIATPFLYLYFLLKIPVGISKSAMLFISFATGLTIDLFSNTPGMHAAACTFVGFFRAGMIRFLIGKELLDGAFPSYAIFGVGGFLRYTALFVFLHHIVLFLVESLTLFDPLFLVIRILLSTILSLMLIAIVEAFNMETVRNGE